MFCPSCGTRNPDGSRFCGACGTDLSARGPGASQAAAPAASVAAGPAARRRRSWRRRAPVAAVAVALVTIAVAGLVTGWFGFARPSITPGTYVLLYSDKTYGQCDTLCVTQNGYMNIPVYRDVLGGNIQINQVKNGDIYGTVDAHYEGIFEKSFHERSNFEDSESATSPTINFVMPQGSPDNITGTWALWVIEGSENRQYVSSLMWAKFSDNGSFKYEVFSSDSSSHDRGSAVALIKAGTFQGDSNAESGRWAKQEDGSYLLTLSNGSSCLYQFSNVIEQQMVSRSFPSLG